MDVINEIFDNGVVERADGSQMPLRDHISREEGRFLLDILKRHLPNGRVVEIGCATGISSLHIGEALRGRDDAEHIIVDPNQSSQYRGCGLHQLARAGLTSHRLIEDLSGTAMPVLLKDYAGQIGAVFIDGYHTFDQTVVDIFYANLLLADGGLIIVDDCALAPVAKAVSYLDQYPAYELAGQCARHTPRQRMGGRVRAILPPAVARAVLPVILYDKYYVRCIYASMVAFRKVGPDVRGWDWFASF